MAEQEKTNGSTVPAQQNDAIGSGVHASHHAGAKEARDRYKAQVEKAKGTKQQHKDPAGGYDGTPVPRTSPGFTVKFTFVRAKNLPMADLASRSSDPYVEAGLIPRGTPQRHAEDPNLTFRTPTVQKNCDPEWNVAWIVGNIPGDGFTLRCKLMDEDPSDHDDRLGDVTVEVDEIAEDTPEVQGRAFKIKKKRGSKRAYLLRGLRACTSHSINMHGELILSIEVLGRTEGSCGKIYTQGPNYWRQHYSPLMGRLAGTKAPDLKNNEGSEKYNFEANEIQLSGPVPNELYHRFVEFKPFVRGMFTGKGIRGILLNHALHHQHHRIYIYDKNTKYGECNGSSSALTKKFLDLVHWDHGARTYTYVLSLDGLFRFTETGKEFGIDMLSKHTMHSNVAKYIACSGEFLIKRRRAHTGSDTMEESSGSSRGKTPDEPKDDQQPDLPLTRPSSGPSASRDPSNYTLIIDNDSGTYRPKGDLLPHLKKFMNANFPGLHVKIMECTDDRLQEMKKLQREKKKRVGDRRQFVQNDSSGSEDFSSSDEEALDEKVKKVDAEKERQGQGGQAGAGAGTVKGKVGKLAQQAAEPERAVKKWIVGDEERERVEELEDQGPEKAA